MASVRLSKILQHILRGYKYLPKYEKRDFRSVSWLEAAGEFL